MKTNSQDIDNMVHRNGNYRHLILGLLVLLCIGACTSVKKFAGNYVPFYSYDETQLTQINVFSSADSNNVMPVAIDFLFIKQIDISKTLLELSGPQWFAHKDGFMLRHKQSVSVLHVEIVPFTAEMPLSLPQGFENAVKVLMFANYIAKPGQYIADLTEFDSLLVTLGKEGYQLKELNP